MGIGVKRRFTITSDDKVEKRRLETDDELNTALWEVFGIKGGKTYEDVLRRKLL